MLFDGFDILGSNLAFHIQYDFSIHAFQLKQLARCMIVAIEYSVDFKKFVKCIVLIGKIDMNLSRLRDVMFNVAGLPCSFHFDVSFSLIPEVYSGALCHLL